MRTLILILKIYNWTIHDERTNRYKRVTAQGGTKEYINYNQRISQAYIWDPLNEEKWAKEVEIILAKESNKSIKLITGFFKSK